MAALVGIVCDVEVEAVGGFGGIARRRKGGLSEGA
jgi:hypothetical protein